MPRPNRPRELFAEEYVARRVAYEREQRGWTYEGLAARLEAVGCAIQPSAIYKIEKGNPRRRITVDELVALAKVFHLTVDEIMVDPATRLPREITRSLERMLEIRARIDENERQKQVLIDDAAAEVQATVDLINREPSLQQRLIELGIADGADGFMAAARDVLGELDDIKATRGKKR